MDASADDVDSAAAEEEGREGSSDSGGLGDGGDEAAVEAANGWLTDGVSSTEPPSEDVRAGGDEGSGGRAGGSREWDEGDDEEGGDEEGDEAVLALLGALEAAAADSG